MANFRLDCRCDVDESLGPVDEGVYDSMVVGDFLPQRDYEE